MDSKKEIRPYLECTNDAGTQFFSEGDAVICFTKSKIYTGVIVAFSNYKESKDAEPQCSVYLDTSKNNMNRSCEIIKVADITYMSKIPLDDSVGYSKMNESLDKDNFINMIVALWQDKEKAEIMYDCMKEFIGLYNIPLSTALTYAIREADLSAEERNVDELMDISSKLLGVMAKVFQSVTDVIMQKAKIGIESGDK